VETILKSIRLPETEIANLAFKSPDVKMDVLTNWLKPKSVKGSYEPLRRSVGDAANVSLPLLPEMQTTSLDQLERLVEATCKGNSDLIKMNLAPAKAIRKFIIDKSAEATFLYDLPITLHPGMRYSFWSPMLVYYDNDPRIVFLDLRRSGGLSLSGLHVCFSIMHDRFRALSTDYADVRLEAWKFGSDTNRTVKTVNEWADPISYSDIIVDVAETYAILNSLRAGDSGRVTGNDYGPLFG
jgi:hypothetical protein